MKITCGADATALSTAGILSSFALKHPRNRVIYVSRGGAMGRANYYFPGKIQHCRFTFKNDTSKAASTALRKRLTL